MSWIGHHLTTLPEAALLWTDSSLDRNLGQIFAHIVERQFECVQRITGEAGPVVPPPLSEEGLEVVRALAETAGEKLRSLATANSERTFSEMTNEGPIRYPSSVLIAGTLEHSMLHREQLLVILQAHDGLGNLPELDHETLAFEEWF